MVVGIVGAGITGLALHHHLRRRGVESVTFEARPEPGGVIRTERRDGRVLELGPQRTRLPPAVADLVEAVGVGDEVVHAADRPLYVYRSGDLREVPFDPRCAVRTDLVSWRGKLRALLEPLADPPRPGETVEGYFARAFGREVAEHVAGPLYGGLYGSHPADMPVEHSLSRALENHGLSGSVLLGAAKALLRGREPPPIGSFVDGMATLPRALYEAHRGSIRLGTPVTALRRTGGGFVLETDRASTAVDRVVLAVPAGAAASLLEGADPASARRLRRLEYNPIAVVHLRAASDLRGAGYQIPFGEPFVTLGATWNASLFDPDGVPAASPSRPAGRGGVYTCFLGGAKAPEAVEWSDGRLGDVAAAEFEAITGRRAEPVRVHRIAPGMPAYDRSWAAIDGLDPPDGVHLAASYRSRAGIPGRVRRAERLARRLADAPGTERPPCVAGR